MISVCKIFYIEAAHWLPRYVGKCANMHGHRWKIEIELMGKEGIPDPASGMIMDFHHIEVAVQPLLDLLDHGVVNRTIENPTAENIAQWFADNLTTLNPCRIRVWETPTSYAEWLP